MSIRGIVSIGLITAAFALASGARAEDAPKAPAERDPPAQSCAHHEKAMHLMKTDKQREAYCSAHKDCMSHNCGGMAEKGHGQGPVDPPEPKAPAKPPKN